MIKPRVQLEQLASGEEDLRDGAKVRASKTQEGQGP